MRGPKQSSPSLTRFTRLDWRQLPIELTNLKGFQPSQPAPPPQPHNPFIAMAPAPACRDTYPAVCVDMPRLL
ncbi:hypothetical protein BC937DRAFT_94858 [Endogone sp. FLAS-F59071]|nr:hypothetical protein BC937DRAFT_94858 [Endogone sp. FLAS-F59071]|eukprot:RUS22929.1 hypothetical protein BC937DRAFT_94858 [Endogone sp. FLAS-F59071]